MKVPGDLLKGMSGDKRRGFTVLSLAAMVLAGISGIVWGLIAVLNPATDTCKVESTQPSSSVKRTTYAEWNKQSEKLADPGCTACGGG